MDFIWNFPLFCIVLCLFSGVLCSVLPSRWAKCTAYLLNVFVIAMSAGIVWYTLTTSGSFTFMMGHYPAPWGNEIRAGVLEGMMALFFSIIMLLSLLAGEHYLQRDVAEGKQNLYYSLTNLLLSSLLALIYTNDMFTAYVFVEINTIAACGLIMIRGNGRSLVASAKYMIMSLIGSGLLLIGITLLYDVTGHLLMCNIREEVVMIMETGIYSEPLTVIIALICVGLAIKSALFPFHSWLPDAYGYSTPSSSAVLSSLVSKAYIFLLVKIFFRVIGWEVISKNRIVDILFMFGLLGMIMGSVSAILQKDLKKMVAYSSVAQIGYIYMGFGLGNVAGVLASIFHILMHAAAKSMLFLSLAGLAEVSGGKTTRKELRGAGFRNKAAGVAFTAGAFSMVGIPLFAGFISKILYATAATGNSAEKMMVTLGVLAVSTILNALYFFRAVICIYTPEGKQAVKKTSPVFIAAMAGFIVINLILGIFSDTIMEGIRTGLRMFI